MTMVIPFGTRPQIREKNPPNQEIGERAAKSLVGGFSTSLRRWRWNMSNIRCGFGIQREKATKIQEERATKSQTSKWILVESQHGDLRSSVMFMVKPKLN